MLQALFHAWERRLASVDHRSRRPPVRLGARLDSARTAHRPCGAAGHSSADWVSAVMADTDAFFTPPPTTDYTLGAAVRRRRSAADVSERARHAARREQHRLRAAVSAARSRDRDRRAAVLVLPQWNSDAGGHVGLCEAARDERHDGAPSQPALSRSAHAAGARIAPTTSSAPMSRERCRCAGRRCSMRGARSPGSPPKGTNASASSDRASDRVCRC